MLLSYTVFVFPECPFIIDSNEQSQGLSKTQSDWNVFTATVLPVRGEGGELLDCYKLPGTCQIEGVLDMWQRRKKNVSSSKLFILQDTTQCLFLCPVNFIITQNKIQKPPLLCVSSYSPALHVWRHSYFIDLIWVHQHGFLGYLHSSVASLVNNRLCTNTTL